MTEHIIISTNQSKFKVGIEEMKKGSQVMFQLNFVELFESLMFNFLYLILFKNCLI